MKNSRSGSLLCIVPLLALPVVPMTVVAAEAIPDSRPVQRIPAPRLPVPDAPSSKPRLAPSVPERRLPGAVIAQLPDLVVLSATVTPKCHDDGTWLAEITATVRNQSQYGTADLSKMGFSIILDASWGFTAGSNFMPPNTSVHPSVGGPKMLAPGQSWTGKLVLDGIYNVKPDVVKLNGHPGAEFSFKVTADPGNGVVESNEKNNDKLLYLPMTTCAHPQR